MATYSAYRTITLSPTVDTNAYASGDVMGGIQTVDASQFLQGFVVNSLSVTNATNTAIPLTLYLFDSLPTATYTDNAAFAPTIADLRKLIGTVLAVTSANFATVNSLQLAQVQDINRVITFPHSTQVFYVVIVANGAVTFSAATDLQIRLTAVS